MSFFGSVLLLLTASPAAYAAPAAGSFALSTAAYVQAVRSASPDLEKARAEYEAASARYRSAVGSAYLPSLSFSARTYPYGHNPLDGNRFRGWDFAGDQSDLQAGASWNLLDYADWFRAKEARASWEIAGRGLESALRDKTMDALRAYYALWLRRKLVEVRQSNLKAQQDQYALTKDLYKHGMKSYADLLKSETDLLSSRLRLSRADGDAREALLRFNVLLRRDADAPADLEFKSAADPALAAADVAADLRGALRRRNEMEGARLSVERAGVRYKRAWAESLPTLALNAAYSWEASAGFGGTYADPSPNPRYYLGLALSLPSGFNGLTQAGNLAAADAERAQARAALDQLELQVREQVVSARIDVERAVDSYGVAKRKEEISKESLDLVTEQYQQGRADVIRLSQAQLDNMEAQVERAQALYDSLVSQAAYRLATGEPM